MKITIQVLEDKEVDIIEALEKDLFSAFFYFVKNKVVKDNLLAEGDDSILVISQELVGHDSELVVLQCGDLEQSCFAQRKTRTQKDVIIEYLKAHREKIIKISDLPGWS